MQNYIPLVSLPRCLVKLPKPPKETGDCMPLASPNCQKVIRKICASHIATEIIEAEASERVVYKTCIIRSKADGNGLQLNAPQCKQRNMSDTSSICA